MPIKSYVQAINEATDQLLSSDNNVLVIGEGVPEGIFGSTKGLKEHHLHRVFDSPLSENAVTGICIGAAISGMRPILTHQRVEFSLLALDQIINNAAKWYSMFGKPCPITIRMIVGRGWGQGPTHSQSLQNLYASIMGLKVVMPTTPHDAKGLLVAAVRDPNPVILIEHRWLYSIQDEVPEEMYEIPLDEAKVLREGEDITIVSLSYSTVESLKARELLKAFNIQPEVIDLISCSHIDMETIGASVRKTGRLLVVDTSHPQGSVGAEVVRQVVENYFHVLKESPKVLGNKPYPQPTSHFLTTDYYTDEYDIANECLRMCGNTTKLVKPAKKDHDIFPGFVGPF